MTVFSPEKVFQVHRVDRDTQFYGGEFWGDNNREGQEQFLLHELDRREQCVRLSSSGSCLGMGLPTSEQLPDQTGPILSPGATRRQQETPRAIRHECNIHTTYLFF